MTARLGSRAWVLGGVIVAVVILAVAWLLVISPVRSDASQLRDDTASVQTQNTVIQAQNNKLRDQTKNQQQLVTELQAALGGLPSGAALPVFSRQLATQAAMRGVTLTGVTIGSPTSSTSSAGSATATTDPASTDPAAAASGTSDTGGTGVDSATPASIPIVVTTDGPVLQQLLFLRDVQQVGPRLALVMSTAFAPAGGSGDGQAGSFESGSTMTLQINVFTNPLPKTTRDQVAELTDAAASDGAGKGSSTSADQG